jgi:2-C-methyl-D-erythritol 2,4-cyclodiphosphate synthase
MEKNIANALNTDVKRINIKATTTEGLGPVGRHEGMAAMCIVLLQDII